MGAVVTLGKGDRLPFYASPLQAWNIAGLHGHEAALRLSCPPSIDRSLMFVQLRSKHVGPMLIRALIFLFEVNAIVQRIP